MTTDQFLSDINSLEIPINGVRLPTYEPSDRHKRELGLKQSCTNMEFLKALCERGFDKLAVKKGHEQYKEYRDRVKYELEIFDELGFVDYVLLVWDVINYCTEHDIPTGLGRGSAAGSLVLYLSGVTRIDPIRFGLYFERFVSKIRAKKTVIDGITYLDGSLMCDVDMDICYYRRPEVLKYIEEKFKGKTAKILTFNTLSAKLLIKEMGKIVGDKSEDHMSDVTNMIPKNHGQVQDIEDTYYGKKDDKGEWKIKPVEEFVEWCNANKRIFETAIKLNGLIKNKGVHPSGMLISFDELADSCPTELSSDKAIVSSFDMNWVSLFTVKLDALGLRGVSVVDDVCKKLGIKLEDIDLAHPSIYQALQDLKYPHGLFQIEADLAYKTTRDVKPKSLSELSAVLALARPGAMQFIDKFALYTNTGTYESIHPFYDDIVGETGGVVLYQEQLMKMAHKIGFTLDEAEILRRIVGKKKVEEMAKWEKKVYDQCAKIGQPKEVGQVLWKVLDASKDYSFNKSHSVCYAALSAITVYLKFNYPTEFYLSLLKMTRFEPDPISEISKIHKEMIHFGIKLLPPDLTKSKMDFSVEDKDIRFGLSSIKGISEKTVAKLDDFERMHANKFQLFESAKAAGLSIGIVAALIQAGTLEGFGKSRSLMVYEAQLWNVMKEKEKIAAMNLGPQFNYHLANIVRHIHQNIKDEKGKPLIKESRMATIKKHSGKYKLIYNQNIECQDFANWWYEKKLMGYVANTTLRNIFRSKLGSLEYINECMKRREGAPVEFIGYIDDSPSLGTSRTAKKSKYLKLMVADETGTCKVMIFNNSLEQCKDLNNGLPKEDDIVIVKGTKKGDDTVFANTIAIQQNVIYTKLADFKAEADDD
jgi:DNA polymerase III subunit alpha